MADEAIASHMDPVTEGSVKRAARSEDVSVSKVVERAVKMQMQLDRSTRSLQQRILSVGSSDERAYLADQLGRATSKAYEDILDGRYADVEPDPNMNTALNTEEAIEAEARRLCSP